MLPHATGHPTDRSLFHKRFEFCPQCHRHPCPSFTSSLLLARGTKLPKNSSTLEGLPPKATASLEQLEREAQAASQECERISAQREQVAQSLRRIGQAYHFVDVERGGRRNGQLIAADIQAQMDTMRTVAPHAGLSQACVDRIDKAERVVPNMQATSELVSGYVRQQVRQLDLTPPVSYAMHAHRMPSCDLERVAQTRTGHAGEPLRELAERRRTPAEEPGGGGGHVEGDGAKSAQPTGPRAGRGVPAVKLQWGRAQRVSVPEEPSTTRVRAPEKTGMADGDAQLFPHAGRWDNRSGAIFRSETAVAVCGDFGIRCSTPSASEATTAS